MAIGSDADPGLRSSGTHNLTPMWSFTWRGTQHCHQHPRLSLTAFCTAGGRKRASAASSSACRSRTLTWALQALARRWSCPRPGLPTGRWGCRPLPARRRLPRRPTNVRCARLPGCGPLTRYGGSGLDLVDAGHHITNMIADAWESFYHQTEQGLHQTPTAMRRHMSCTPGAPAALAH